FTFKLPAVLHVLVSQGFQSLVRCSRWRAVVRIVQSVMELPAVSLIFCAVLLIPSQLQSAFHGNAIALLCMQGKSRSVGPVLICQCAIPRQTIFVVGFTLSSRQEVLTRRRAQPLGICAQLLSLLGFGLTYEVVTPGVQLKSLCLFLQPHRLLVANGIDGLR